MLFESNLDFGAGPTQRGFQYILNVQPLVPFSLNGDWNVVASAFLPVLYLNKVIPGAGDQLGLGDATFQFFFSPKQPTKDGIYWGIGPSLFAPTGTEPLLSARTWGAGIAGTVMVQLHQKGGVFTAGINATQTWSVAGPATINSLFLQPFLDYTFPNSVNIGMLSESSYDWNQGQLTTAAISLTVGKLFKLGDHLMAFDLGPQYYPGGPAGPASWGIRSTLVLLFP